MEGSWGRMVVQLLLFFLHSLSSLGQSPYQRAMALQGRRAWTPNYCNNSRLMEEMGLAKTALGAFIGYPCDPNYFACSWAKDGWRSFRRQCAVGQIFDPSGIQNCTFKDNVPACAQEKEAVCSDLCIAEEFEFECCLSEECVAAGKRCDGNMDCTFEEDEKNCAHCKPGEMPCAKADTPTCISLSQRCDDTPDCPDGSDERFCDECENNNFYCLGSKRCVDQAARCDGERDCTYGEDEVYCWKPDPFHCQDANNTQIDMDLTCNGFDDCPDGSDEAACQHISVEPDPDQVNHDYQASTDKPGIPLPGK